MRWTRRARCTAQRCWRHFRTSPIRLHAIEFDAETLRANLSAERSAERSLAYARNAHDLGSVSYLALLNAEQAYQQAVVNRVQAQASRLGDSAALFQALGGGWWNRDRDGAATR
jgi:outer membrane protein TolC